MNLTIGIAFTAGILSIFSPCIIPLIPSYFAYLTGIPVKNLETHRKKVFFHSLAFTLGFSIVFITIGAVVGTIGEFFLANKRILEIIGGILLTFFSFQIFGIFKFWQKEKKITAKLESVSNFSILKSFLTGIIFAFGWSPCYGPIIGGIFTLALSEADFSKGILLFAFYALGMAIPLVILGTISSKISEITAKTRKVRKTIEIIMGCILLLLAINLFFGTSAYIANTINELYIKYGINIP